MATPPAMQTPDTEHEQLRSFVRFSLAQLRTRNDHHRFEHLCAALARQRITPNIVVGTGPVAAGGDQGRDFETFRGYGHGHVRELGRRLGIRDADAIVFCCTVSQADIGRKILDDVKMATSSGGGVDVIVYFTEQDVPTAKRHDLIARVASDYEVRLEVLDGQTLTSLLCDRDTFWIAVEFLDIPVHLAPEDAGPEWYAGSRARWLSRTMSAATSGDLIEITMCVRFATENQRFRGDIPMWLDRLLPFLDPGADPLLRRRARYETAVARYMGLADLRPADDLVRSVLEEAILSESIEELYTADILRQFAYAAWLYAVTGLTAEELDAFGTRVETRLTELVCTATDHTRRCRLLWILGRIRLRSDTRALNASGFTRGEVEPPPPMTEEEWGNFLALHPLQQIDVSFVVDRDGALTAWREAAGLVDSAPLFPVREFAQNVSLYAPYLHDDPAWAELVAVLDQKVALAAGRYAAAELARSRSVSLQAAGRPFAALTELHRAREALVTGDSRLEGAQALLDAAEVYQSLGLLYAAKHYGLAAGAVAALDHDADDRHPLVAASLILAADCDFTAGNWFSLLAFLPMAVDEHLTRRVMPDEPGLWEDFGRLMAEVAVVTKVTAVVGSPLLAKWVDSRLTAARLDPDELRTVSLPGLGEDDPKATLDAAAGSLMQPPFADSGARRLIRFETWGVSWIIEITNTYDGVRAAERLAAAIQIVLAALGDQDLVLVETTVHLVVRMVMPNPDRTARTAKPRHTGRTPDGAIKWSVPLTRDRGPHSVEMISATREVAAMALAAIVSLSLLPDDAITAVTRQLVADDTLIRALFPHIRYDRAYAVLSRQAFAESKRRKLNPVMDPTIRYGDELALEYLAPTRRPGPTFRGQTARERIAERYNVFATMLRFTLPRLARDRGFQAVVSELRAAGWKDWHILMAVANVVFNQRLVIRGEDPSDPTIRERWDPTRPEGPTEPVIDAADLTSDVLRLALMGSTGATVDAYGLTMRTPFTPAEILHILATRYGYWEDDTAHDDPFAGGGGGENSSTAPGC